MKMRSNTIFITGGTSGIGQGLAEAFHKLGNQVIITGRREYRLKEICGANPGMRYFVLDVSDARAVSRVAKQATEEFPKLNCVFNNAGVQKDQKFSVTGPLDETSVGEELDTNILGVMRVAAEFIPHLQKQKDAVLVNVSSGLAFVPLARFPVYCATKAFVHSYTQSLRRQLRDSGIQVIELIPPYVATELGGPDKNTNLTGVPQPMPLDTFIAETMKELATEETEVAIGPSKNLAGATPTLARQMFAGMNG
jgi:uncharacterized oxidoreductase